ncbi:hypothetical protein HYDPIDRAFT_175185 [Hydnomerulius pinastri MD-312]|uniref:Carbonic anhydrase n=1 Tax=Hydnomerulius pinastri MD-312 TaxID=994086 RepID=A0A0C9VHP0_9AGAM|nr:hypothetical protein HYDPIDRAFT_175185 [Hydnomerulius pinastri MD-312]
MSESQPSQGRDVKDIASEVLAAHLQWARRMNQVYQDYFPDPKNGQAPKILWVGCSDSRVLECDATMAKPGDVFVHRNIANQFHLNDDSALSVLAYALKELKVQHVIVVGHTHCGGAITAMKEASIPPGPTKRHHTLVDSLYKVLEYSSTPNEVHDEHSKDPSDALTRWLTPLVDHIRGLVLPADEETALDVVVEENVKLQVKNLTQLEGFVQKSAKERPVWVHGWVYDFATGNMKDLQVTKELGRK